MPCVSTVAHDCSGACLNGDDNPAKYKGYNPLCIPMEFGWTRYEHLALTPICTYGWDVIVGVT